MASKQLIFPASLSARQRAVLHELADTAGIPHKSTGTAEARILRLGTEGAGVVEVQYPCCAQSYYLPCGSSCKMLISAAFSPQLLDNFKAVVYCMKQLLF